MNNKIQTKGKLTVSKTTVYVFKPQRPHLSHFTMTDGHTTTGQVTTGTTTISTNTVTSCKF